jgi:hypothetical protein
MVHKIDCAGKDSGCAPIGEGDGDCDTDADCQEGLKCGTDNCVNYHHGESWPASNADGWDKTDDCCYMPGLCRGKDSDCKYPLRLGDGDCDSDDQCAEGLKCGTDNCNEYHRYAGWTDSDPLHWDTTDDCCYDPYDSKQCPTTKLYDEAALRTSSTQNVVLSFAAGSLVTFLLSVVLVWRRSKQNRSKDAHDGLPNRDAHELSSLTQHESD